MNLKISAYKPINCYNRNNNHVRKSQNITFHRPKNKIVRNISLALFMASLFAAVSCIDKNKQTHPVGDNTLQKTEQNDNVNGIPEDNNTNINQPQKRFHYLPKDKDIQGEDYDWSETIYPDGSIQKDSSGYQISITADGERTTVQTKTDSLGNIITETEFPDSTKNIKIDYQPNDSNKIAHMEQTFWPNGNIKESKYYYNIKTDSSDVSAIPKPDVIEHYNENEVLIYWESKISNSEKNDSNNIYDKYGRIEYDDIKSENYQYKGKSKIPYRSISHYNDCIRITEYQKDGTVKKIYFKASDGTITESK